MKENNCIFHLFNKIFQIRNPSLEKSYLYKLLFCTKCLEASVCRSQRQYDFSKIILLDDRYEKMKEHLNIKIIKTIFDETNIITLKLRIEFTL